MTALVIHLSIFVPCGLFKVSVSIEGATASFNNCDWTASCSWACNGCWWHHRVRFRNVHPHLEVECWNWNVMNISNLALFHCRADFLLSYHITLHLSYEWLSSVWHFGSHRGGGGGGVGWKWLLWTTHSFKRQLKNWWTRTVRKLFHCKLKKNASLVKPAGSLLGIAIHTGFKKPLNLVDDLHPHLPTCTRFYPHLFACTRFYPHVLSSTRI